MLPIKSSSVHLAVTVLLINVALSQAMLPPPMLRAVCGAFADAEEAMGAKALAAGKVAVDMAMKPIAIVGGLKAAAVGTGMKIGGGAIKLVGEKMVKDGAIIEATGAGVKGAGLGVASLALKPAAEKIVLAGTVAEKKIAAVGATADKFVKNIGDTAIQIEATVDSPIVGHHHKEISMTNGQTSVHEQHLQANQVEQQVEQQQQVEQLPAKTKRAAPKIDPDVLNSALNLVKEAKMEDCVARAICDLNCNPQGFGNDGKQVFMNMVRLQSSNLLESQKSKYFVESASKGRSYSGKCDQCSEVYPKCNSKSADLIKMASHLKLD